MIAVCLVFHSATAQNAAQSAVNSDHDKFIGLYQKSVAVALPDSVYNILKNFAFVKSYPESTVLKNEYMLKVIYNNELSISDRLYACDFLSKQYAAPQSYVPVFLIDEMKNSLILKAKSND